MYGLRNKFILILTCLPILFSHITTTASQAVDPPVYRCAGGGRTVTLAPPKGLVAIVKEYFRSDCTVQRSHVRYMSLNEYQRYSQEVHPTSISPNIFLNSMNNTASSRTTGTITRPPTLAGGQATQRLFDPIGIELNSLTLTTTFTYNTRIRYREITGGSRICDSSTVFPISIPSILICWDNINGNYWRMNRTDPRWLGGGIGSTYATASNSATFSYRGLFDWSGNLFSNEMNNTLRVQVDGRATCIFRQQVQNYICLVGVNTCWIREMSCIQANLR